MPDAGDIKAPINPSHDFQLGIVFARLDGHDDRFDSMDSKIAGLIGDIKEVNHNLQEVKTEVVSSVKQMLDAQTAELKPLVTEKMVRDANAKAAAEAKVMKSTESQTFWMRASVIIAATGLIWGFLLWYDKTYWHPEAPPVVIAVPAHSVQVTHSP